MKKLLLAASFAAFALNAQAGQITWRIDDAVLHRALMLNGNFGTDFPLHMDAARAYLIIGGSGGAFLSAFGPFQPNGGTVDASSDDILDMQDISLTAPSDPYDADVDDSVSIFSLLIELVFTPEFMAHMEGTFFPAGARDGKSLYLLTGHSYDDDGTLVFTLDTYSELQFYFNIIPEPATGLLVLGGAAMLLLRRRRR